MKSDVLLIVLLLIFVDNIVCQCIYELNDINYWNIISGEWETTSNGYIKVNESITDSSILITDDNIIPGILGWNKYSMSVNMSILPAKLESTYPDGYVCVIFNAQNISSKMQYCVFQFLCHTELWEINDRIGIFDTTFNDTNGIILKVDIDGYKYKIYLNDILVTSGVSSFYDHGSVGFYSWKSSVALESITVNVSENICYNGSQNISVAPTTQPTTTVLSDAKTNNGNTSMSHVNWILISIGISMLICIIIACVLIYRKKLYKKVATTDDLSYMRLEDNSALTLLATPETTKGNESNNDNISKPIKNIDFENEYEMTSNKLITKGQKNENLKPEIMHNNNSKRVRWSKLINNNKKRASNVERITNDNAKYGEDSPAMSLFSKLNKSEGIVKLKSNINFYNNNGNKNNNNNNNGNKNNNILLEYEPNNSDKDGKSDDDDINEIDKPNTMQF